jgi:hypothetical protein
MSRGTDAKGITVYTDKLKFQDLIDKCITVFVVVNEGTSYTNKKFTLYSFLDEMRDKYDNPSIYLRELRNCDFYEVV